MCKDSFSISVRSTTFTEKNDEILHLTNLQFFTARFPAQCSILSSLVDTGEVADAQVRDTSRSSQSDLLEARAGLADRLQDSVAHLTRLSVRELLFLPKCRG